MNLEQGLLFYDQLTRFQPYLIESLYYFILILTNFILDNNLKPIPIAKMFMHGMPLMKEKKKIEKAFSDVEIYNNYASHEFEGIACECSEHLGLHMSIDAYMVEFIREDSSVASPGEIARIIITDLDNKVMPLIRYEIGDMGWYLDKRCSCGRGLPLMSNLAGRKSEYVVSADNKKFYFSFFQDFFDRYHEVRYFQVHQNGKSSIEVQIVQDHEVDENMLSAKIIKELNEYLRTGVTIKYVDALLEEKNGRILPIKRIN
jgi:phenylacetate-CoA ligase